MVQPKRTTSKLSAADIQAQFTHLATDVRRTGNSLKRRRADLTDKGYKDEWGRLTADHKLRAAQLAQLPDKWAAQAVTARDAIRDALLPTTDDPTAQLAAEAAWNRLTSRRAYRSAEPMERFAMIRDEVQNMPASPARTLLLNEAVTRGDMKAEAIEGILKESDETYRDACKAADYASTTAAALNRRADGIMDSLTSPESKAPGAWHTFDVNNIPGADTVRDTGTGTAIYDGPTIPDLPVTADLPTSNRW